MTLHRILPAATCAAALVACAGTGCTRDRVAERSLDQGATDRSGVGTTTLTGADIRTISSESAIERIVVVRCTRETACNNIGSDKHFANYDACGRDLRSTIGADLEPSKCPRGIDMAAVDRCTDAIRNESCNNPVDTLSRLAACRASSMCIAE